MIISPLQARDEMFNLVTLSLIKLNILLGYTPEIRWQGIEESNKPNINKIWLRVLKQEIDENKDYIGNSTGQYISNHIGILSIEVFGPTADLTTWDKINSVAKIIRDNFKYTSSLGIRFYKSKIVETNSYSNIWYKLNVVVNYSYDENH